MNLTKLLVITLCVILLSIHDVDGKKKKKKKGKKSSKFNNKIFKPVTTTKTITTVPTTTSTKDKTDRTPAYVPPEILKKLRNVNDVGSFIKEFKPAGVEQAGQVLKYVTNGVEVKMDIPATDDLGCTPRIQVEQVPTTEGFFTFPVCEKVPRCGGCCQQPNKQCEAVGFEKVTKSVFSVSYATGIAKLENREAIHHTKCACKCKVKPSDCLPSQTYNNGNCQCECRQPAADCGVLKFWSTYYCGCKCAVKKTPCSTWKKEWSDDKCACICIKKPETCSAKGKTLDPITCKCL